MIRSILLSVEVIVIVVLVDVCFGVNDVEVLDDIIVVRGLFVFLVD